MGTSYEYTKNGEPSTAKIRENVAVSSMTEKTIVKFYDGVRIRDPETKELTSITFKIEMNSDLSAEDKTLLDAIVATAVAAGPGWRREVGSEYFELSSGQEQGWVVRGGRVKFEAKFVGIPNVVVSNAVADGSFDLTVSQVDPEYFDYQARAKVRGRGALTIITFDWEAVL